MDSLSANLFLELECQACTDVLQDSRGARLFKLLDVADVLMIDLIDKEHRATA